MAKQDDGDGTNSGTKNGRNPDNGNSEFENFQNLLKRVLSVPKEEVDEKREQEKNEERAG